MRALESEDTYAPARAAMVRALRLEITDERVLQAFARVPRERFVPLAARHLAYMDRPIAIGHGQTLSPPLMVAVMLLELRLKGQEKVLEIGTGSGYQAALLAELAATVVTVELIPELAAKAAEVLHELGYRNVTVHLASEDVLGWPAEAPYDAIVVAAAAPRVPQSLVDQLAAGGRLVLPVGERTSQELMVVEKRPEGVTVTRKGGCRFVPLIGREAFPADEFSDPNL
jgi:protein-L-isoaspartate(D-aspartate) O-methyltransferase